MGDQRLQRQAEELEKEYDDVSEKVRSGMKNMAEKIKVQHVSLHLNSNHCLNQICRIICIFFFFLVGIFFNHFFECLLLLFYVIIDIN